MALSGGQNLINFAALGGVSGLTSSKQTTELNNNDNRAPILCPKHEITRSDDRFYYLFFAVIAESKLQKRTRIEAGRLVAATLLRSHCAHRMSCRNDLQATSNIFWLDKNRRRNKRLRQIALRDGKTCHSTVTCMRLRLYHEIAVLIWHEKNAVGNAPHFFFFLSADIAIKLCAVYHYCHFSIFLVLQLFRFPTQTFFSLWKTCQRGSTV